MRSWFKATALVLLLLSTYGCSGSGSPVSPGLDTSPVRASSYASRHLWWIWDVNLDLSGNNVEMIPSRGTMFTCNVTHFVAGPPVEMKGHLIDYEVTPEYINATVDIWLKNPFEETLYPGFDVIAVVMVEGSVIYPGPQAFAVPGESDQTLLNPDGFTRWFNYPEFSGAGSIWEMFGYNAFTTGLANIVPSAQLNPYIYYTDSLGLEEYAWDYVGANAAHRGSFSPQEENERRMYFHFPTEKGVGFKLAIVASWKANYNNPDPPDGLYDFPPEANADEALLVDIDDESTVYYIDEFDNGGNVRLDISPWDWSATLTSTVIEEYEIHCWSPAWSGDGDVDMTPVYSALNYFTFKTAIPVTGITSMDPVPVWIEVMYPGIDYSNDFGVPNDAVGDLASYFYYEIPVHDYKPVWINVIEPNGGEELEVGKEFEILWETENLNGNIFIMYSLDDFQTDIHPVAVNEPNDGSFLWENIPDVVADTVKIRVSSMLNSSMNDVSDDYFTIYDSTEPFIRVISPNGGELWKSSTAREIRWVWKNVPGNLFIEYSKDQFVSDFHIIDIDVPNTGSYLWEDIPYDLSETVRVRISSMLQPSIFDISDNDFTIDDPPIEVLSPDGGEEWKAGLDAEIQWETIDFTGTLKIEYSTDYFVSTVNEIASDVEDTGSYTWSPVPNDPSTTARVRISSMDDPSVRDISDGNFSIEESGWGLSFGGISNEVAYDIELDSDGNIFIAGIFRDTDVDFNPDPVLTDLHSAVGGTDVFLCKFNSLAQFEWARTWGGIAYDRGYGLTVDPDGNAFVIGVFKGTNVDFDPDPGITEKDQHSAVGSYDIFVSKFDTDGDYLWAQTFGGYHEDKGSGIDSDQFGNVYLTGSFTEDVDFDPGTGDDTRSALGLYDVFMLSLDADGNYIWANTFGGDTTIEGYDHGYALKVGDFGDLYLAGNVAGENIDMDPDPIDSVSVTALGGCDAFISKFDLSGNFEWAGIWGGYEDDYGFELTTDPDGNVYITGRYEGFVDFDPGFGAEVYISNGEGYDAYVSKFDFLGQHLWAKVWGGLDVNTYGWSVDVNSAGYLYVIGSFEGTCDFDPGPGTDELTSNGEYDIFLSSFNTSGWYNWGRTWGGVTPMDNGYGVSCDSNGNAFISGSIAGYGVDFEPGDGEDYRDTMNGDAFLMKVMPDGEW